ncbi:hypothetical protein D1872_285850 [compost metagenome]
MRRLRLVVPTTAPSGSASTLSYFSLNNASRTSSRLVIAPRSRPSGNSVGTSFRLCTAICASPLSIASSSSLVKRPLPPIFAKGVSRMTSPFVFMIFNSTSRPECLSSRIDLMCSDCQSASLLPLVAIISFCMLPLFVAE